MPLFIDHFHGIRILADPQKITNQFSWLLVLMIASIRAMNNDCWSLRTHFTAHDVEAAAACFLAQLSQGIGKPQRAIELAALLTAQTNHSEQYELRTEDPFMPLDLIGAVFCHAST